MKIVWSPTAKDRLHEILEYIAKDDPHAAIALIDSIEEKVTYLLQHPESGRSITHVEDSAIRELIVQKNYGVIYELTEYSIHILTVKHFKQNYQF